MMSKENFEEIHSSNALYLYAFSPKDCFFLENVFSKEIGSVIVYSSALFKCRIGEKMKSRKQKYKIVEKCSIQVHQSKNPVLVTCRRTRKCTFPLSIFPFSATRGTLIELGRKTTLFVMTVKLP